MKHLIILVSFWTICLCDYRTSNQRAQYNTYDSGNNNMEWSGYSYSLDDGQCSGTKLVDEDVKKDADQYTYKKTTYTWNGRQMYRITCVRVLNRMSRDENAAEARISDGGVGQGQVRIEMRSKDSQRTHFHVEIWGEETRAASGVALLTQNLGNYLYMNGKKYCECR